MSLFEKIILAHSKFESGLIAWAKDLFNAPCTITTQVRPKKTNEHVVVRSRDSYPYRAAALPDADHNEASVRACGFTIADGPSRGERTNIALRSREKDAMCRFHPKDR